MVRKYKNYSTEFGVSARRALAERQMTQLDLANSTGVSCAYTNALITGKKKPSPQWVDLISDTLNLTPEQRQELHVAAAKDHGFKLDLSK